MDKYKTAKFVPSPIDEATIRRVCGEEAAVAAGSEGSSWTRTKDANVMWNEADCIRELVACGCDLWCDGELRGNMGKYEFDKDDKVSHEPTRIQ